MSNFSSLFSQSCNLTIDSLNAFLYYLCGSLSPSQQPTLSPTVSPTFPPSLSPTITPTLGPTISFEPTPVGGRLPTRIETEYPTGSPPDNIKPPSSTPPGNINPPRPTKLPTLPPQRAPIFGKSTKTSKSSKSKAGKSGGGGKSGKSDGGKSGKSGGRSDNWIDYDGDDDVPFSKSSKSSDKYNSLLNQEDGYTVAQEPNQSEKGIQKQYVVWSLSIVLLPLVI
mmetsp:Transcript_26157/g.56156  ORF Transcript_26157/g.56156 Transcript_26157/m.56156 type:complete len:224 (-) Transcript_26157:189-860(-)